MWEWEWADIEAKKAISLFEGREIDEPLPWVHAMPSQIKIDMAMACGLVGVVESRSSKNRVRHHQVVLSTRAYSLWQ